MANTTPDTPRYTVVTYGRNHYVTGGGEFIPFTSKREAQERADWKNANYAARVSASGAPEGAEK